MPQIRERKKNIGITLNNNEGLKERKKRREYYY